MSALRAALILGVFFFSVLMLCPLQWLLIHTNSKLARLIPHQFHKFMCWVMRVRIYVDGDVRRDQPVLLISNHISWLDIMVLSSLAPLSYVAKKEVNSWPWIKSLARLQRTIFVDRERRTKVGHTAKEIAERLREGDCVVLFAEGTSSDGNRVLPFKSSLFAAAASTDKQTMVQTCALAYTHMGGLPMGRMSRPLVAWYGDMEMVGHAWDLLKSGTLDVHVRIGEPQRLENFEDRKALARYTEDTIRADMAELLTLKPGELKREPTLELSHQK